MGYHYPERGGIIPVVIAFGMMALVSHHAGSVLEPPILDDVSSAQLRDWDKSQYAKFRLGAGVILYEECIRTLDFYENDDDDDGGPTHRVYLMGPIISSDEYYDISTRRIPLKPIANDKQICNIPLTVGAWTVLPTKRPLRGYTGENPMKEAVYTMSESNKDTREFRAGIPSPPFVFIVFLTISLSATRGVPEMGH